MPHGTPINVFVLYLSIVLLTFNSKTNNIVYCKQFEDWLLCNYLDLILLLFLKCILCLQSAHMQSFQILCNHYTVIFKYTRLNVLLYKTVNRYILLSVCPGKNSKRMNRFWWDFHKYCILQRKMIDRHVIDFNPSGVFI